jgi:hypothetical protein
VKTLHPNRYHGHHEKPPFFEGWYFKLVDATGDARCAIIPGIILNQDPAKAHAFVQVLDGASGQATYHRYPQTLFWASRSDFDIRIGPNRFNERFLALDIKDEQRTIRGMVRFRGITPWPVTLTSPGAMGWYAWMPFMETYHGVVSLDHELEGELDMGYDSPDYDGGRGYIEKDWGSAFPSDYIWMQCNDFGTAGTSLTASIATIPWLTGSFPGFIVGFLHDGQLYRFATYTGAETERLEVTATRVIWIVRDRYRRLRIEATRAPGVFIYGPQEDGHMVPHVEETLEATISVYLQEWHNRERLIFSGTGHHAGLEIHGNLEPLVRMA